MKSSEIWLMILGVSIYIVIVLAIINEKPVYAKAPQISVSSCASGNCGVKSSFDVR